MWFPWLRIVARLARLAVLVVGGPLFRNVKRPPVWAHFVVGGGLFRNVSTLDNRAGYGPRGRAGFLVMASGGLQGSHSVAWYHKPAQRCRSVDASGTVTPSAIVARSWLVCFGSRNRSRQIPRLTPMTVSTLRRVKTTASQSAFCKKWNLSADKFLGINPKTVKSIKNGDPDVRILNLAPAELSGFNVCPGSGNCRKVCLHFAGNPVGMSAKTLCRIRKTHAFYDNPQSFVELLIVAILGESFKLDGAPMAVRLNGTSDVKWEDVDFEVTVEFAAFCNRKFGVILLVGKQNIFELFQLLGLNIVFYDYTKIRRDWAKCAKLGYHLTFSFDGWNNTANLKLCREAIANGVNIAAAFNLKKSLSLPTILEGGNLVDFNIPIVDGDLTDYRPADPAGVIVGLHYKHPLGLKMGPVEKDLFKRAFCIS